MNPSVLTITNRLTGANSSVSSEDNVVSLTAPSDVRLDIARGDIASTEPRGDDLVVTLQDGRQIVLENFFGYDEDGIVSRLVVDGEIIDSAGLSSGLLVGLGVLAVGAALAGGSSSSDADAEAASALAKIAAYADDNSNPVPTVQDYADAGVTGVDAANLADVNAAVDAVTGTEADTTPEVQALVDAVPAAVIDLSGEGGFQGQLINPVQVLINGETRTFYYWDRDGSGDSSSGNGGVTDFTTHNELDTLFNAGSDTTDALGDRSYTMGDGTELRLPTINGADGFPGAQFNPGTTVSSGTEDQTTYDGLLAIWDAHNGSGTGTSLNGTPPGWAPDAYWSASSTGSGSHARLALSDGLSYSGADGGNLYVALEVV